MGTVCGSARDSTQPTKPSRSSQIQRHRDKKLTSLDDVLKVKQRRNSDDVRRSTSLKRQIYERKFSLLLKRDAPIQIQQ